MLNTGNAIVLVAVRDYLTGICPNFLIKIYVIGVKTECGEVSLRAENSQNNRPSIDRYLTIYFYFSLDFQCGTWLTQHL